MQNLRLYRRFLHPSTVQFYKLLRQAEPECLEQETKSLIEEITKACGTCAEISDRPITFSVRTPDDIRFSQELLIDMLYFNNRPMLHVIDRGTPFSPAKYPRRAHPKTLWNMLVQAWSFLYVGHPESILTDQGSVFRSKE